MSKKGKWRIFPCAQKFELGLISEQLCTYIIFCPLSSSAYSFPEHQRHKFLLKLVRWFSILCPDPLLLSRSFWLWQTRGQKQKIKLWISFHDRRVSIFRQYEGKRTSIDVCWLGNFSSSCITTFKEVVEKAKNEIEQSRFFVSNVYF